MRQSPSSGVAAWPRPPALGAHASAVSRRPPRSKNQPYARYVLVVLHVHAPNMSKAGNTTNGSYPSFCSLPHNHSSLLYYMTI